MHRGISNVPVLLSGGGASSLLTSIVAAWGLSEASAAATRADSVGTSTLSPYGNPPRTTGPGSISYAIACDRATQQLLNCADNAALSMGAGVSFTISVWASLASKPGDMAVLTKWNYNAGSREYTINYVSGTNRLTFSVSSDGGNGGRTDLAASSLGSPATATWYHILAWHDVAGTINIQINGGTVNSAAHADGVLNGSSNLEIGSMQDDASLLFDGKIAAPCLWKRVLTSGERAALYAGGAGLAYPFS